MQKQGNNVYLRKDSRIDDRCPKDLINGKISCGHVSGETIEDDGERSDRGSFWSLVSPSNSTEKFETIALEWLESLIPQLKISSIAKYTNILKLYLIPCFGERQIDAISRKEVTQFSLKLLNAGGPEAKGLAPKTVNSIISVMRSIFNYSSREKGLQIADIKDISIKQPQKPMRILSLNEQQRLGDHLCADLTPCNLGILLCLYTGLRIGEVCALKWADIFIKEQYLLVRHSMQRVQTNNHNKRKTEIVIQPPKSDHSIRKIPIPNGLITLLLLSQKCNEAFLLTGAVHSFIEPRCLENHFKAAAKACDIQDVNFHALRHTFATRCVELGFDLKSLSEILGHASVNITLNRYVHPSMELKQKNMNMLSDLLAMK